VRSLLALGILAGAALGLVAGLAEVVLAPLDEPLRIPFVLGADGLVGAAWGLLAALTRISPGARRSPAAAVGSLLGVASFPLLAAAFGLLVNRVLLSGTHFLSPVSLFADGVALVAAAVVSFLAARGTRRALERARRRPGAPAGAAVVVLVLLLAAYLLPSRFVPTGAPDSQLPPVVLVSIDTLRPDKLTNGGEPRPTSPEIDRLSREGVQFTEAVTVSPGSAASHAALLTSRYPVSNGVWANFSVMDPSVETIAETLKAKGYRTGGFVTNTFLGRRFHFDQGFDTYVESGMVERLDEPSGAALRRSLAIVQIADRIRHRLTPGYDPSFESALAWLEESELPTFLFLQLMDVHSPYVPPDPYGPRFGATPEGSEGSPRHRNRFGWRPSEEAYLAEIRFLDAKIGRLRRALEARGLLDRAVVVLTSDHGENLLDHEPNFSHGATLYDSTVRILAAVRAPGRVRGGGLDPRPFENVDVLPTLADLARWDAEPAWEGRSFAAYDVPPLEMTVAQVNRDFAVRNPDWKVVLYDSGEREVWDLDRDPGETAPVVDAALVTRAEEHRAAWMQRYATPLYLEQARSVKPEELSPETLDKLRALGYVD